MKLWALGSCSCSPGAREHVLFIADTARSLKPCIRLANDLLRQEVCVDACLPC